jgi:hypothetical protein
MAADFMDNGQGMIDYPWLRSTQAYRFITYKPSQTKKLGIISWETKLCPFQAILPVGQRQNALRPKRYEVEGIYQIK